MDTVSDPESLADSLPGSMQSLSDACAVVDALGPQARKDLMDEFVQLQMLPYERIFAPGSFISPPLLFTSDRTISLWI